MGRYKITFMCIPSTLTAIIPIKNAATIISLKMRIRVLILGESFIMGILNLGSFRKFSLS